MGSRVPRVAGRPWDNLGVNFPSTRRSAVLAAGSEDAVERRQAFEVLVATYWRPIYKYVRLKWGVSGDEAQDLTQGFFARAIEKDFFAGYDRTKGSFRTFLRTCLDGFVANEKKSAQRIKRGGGTELLSLDFESAEGELQRYEPPAGLGLEEYFRREWVRGLFGLAVDSLREECATQGKQAHFRLFERYDLDEAATTYEELAREFGVSVTDVTNHLAFARRQFRRIVLEKLRDSTGDEQEFRSEARLLLGVDPA